MKKFLAIPLLFFATTAVSLLTSCSSAHVVDYDRAALEKFSSYECFSIQMPDESKPVEDEVFSPILNKRIAASLERVLLERGYRNDCKKPDFYATYFTTSKTRTALYDNRISTTYPTRYPFASVTGSVELDEYEEGTFVVDILDGQSGQLVWRGSYATRLGRTAPSDQKIEKMLREILAQFPPQK